MRREGGGAAARSARTGEACAAVCPGLHSRVYTPTFARAQGAFMSQEEYLQTVASRVLYSSSCGAFYLSLLVASLTEIIWMLHPWIGHCCHLSYPKSKVFFAVEAYLSIGLFGETALRLIWQRRRFWSDGGNIFDAAVSVLSM